MRALAGPQQGEGKRERDAGSGGGKERVGPSPSRVGRGEGNFFFSIFQFKSCSNILKRKAKQI